MAKQMPQHAELTDLDRATLDFERHRWGHQGAREQAIREAFGESLTRYHQRLGALLEQPGALAYDATLVRRLQRLRDARIQQRSAGRGALRGAASGPVGLAQT